MTHRGIQCNILPTLSDLLAARDLGCNLVRYQLYCAEGQNWDETMEIYLQHLEMLLPSIKGLDLTLSLNTPPGPLFTSDPQPAMKMVNFWGDTAKRFAGKVWAFSILNEPAGTALDVANLMMLCATAIRTEDPKSRIVVSVPYCNPTFLSHAQPLPVPHLLYDFHMYDKLSFSHQGVYPQYPVGQIYPDPSKGFTKEHLIRIMNPAASFAARHGVKIYVSEFGCSIHTDDSSRAAWFTDVISIIEANGWLATAHSYRESPQWDLEHPEVVLDIFKAWFAKNRMN